jgi:hypothetical protein
MKIQKHYEFYLANKFKSHSLCARTAFPFTEALTLRTDVIPEHGTEDKILFGCQLVEWTIHYQSDGFETLGSPEEKIQALAIHWLQEVMDILPSETVGGKLLIFLVESEEHHTPHTFFVLIDMVHEHFQIDGHHILTFHANYFFMLQ